MNKRWNWRKGVLLGWALGWAVMGIGPCGAEEAPKPVPSAQAEASTDALFEQAQQARKEGQHDRAIALLTQLLERDPKNVEAYIVRARGYSDQKKLALAIADYQQAIKLEPKNADAQGSLGWVFILTGRFEEARTPTEKAHELSPDTFAWLVNLGDLSLLAGDREQARAWYRRGLEKIQSTEDFEQGFIADLELFIKKGWQSEAAGREEIAWLRETFAPRQPWLALNEQRQQARKTNDLPTAEKAARAALEIAETSFGPEHPDTATSLNNLVVLLQAQGRLAEAEPLARRALAIREKVLDPEHPDTAASLNNLAWLLQVQGRLAEAEPLARRTLAIHEKVLSPEHPDTATSLNNLAWLLQVQGRLAEAEPLARRTLAIHEKVLSPEHPDTATSLNNLALLLQAQGRLAEAEPLARRALAIHEKVLSPEHPDTATSLNNLALLLQAQGRFAEAEPLARRALAIHEKVLSPEHPDTATSLNNLALLLQAQGRFAEAEPLIRRALAIREKVLDPEHPDTAISLSSLAVLLKNQGRLAEAEPLYRRALAISEKVLGPEHPHTASSLSNLAVLLQAQGRLAEAEPLYRRALAIREKALGPEHPDTGTSLSSLAVLLQAQGRLAEAEPLYRRALAIHEKVLGPEHPHTASSLSNLAVLLQAQGRFAEAEPLARRALAIREKVLDPEHPHTASSLSSLAVLLKDQGRLAEAEPLYRRALAIHEKILGPEHPRTATSLSNLAVLLAQDRFAEAEPLARRALAIHEKALGPEHPDTAASLHNLATLLKDQGRLAEAEPLSRRALAIQEQANQPIPYLYINKNLGTLLVALNRPQEALPYYRTATETLDRLFANTQGLPEEARYTFLGRYAHIYREFLELLLTLHKQDAKAGYDREFLAVASRNQSRLFSELLRQGDVQRFSQEPQFLALKDQRQTLLNQLQALREKRALLPISAPNAEGQKADLSQRINALTAQLEPLQAQLQRDYPRYMELLQPAPVTVEHLQHELLRPGEALLSIVLLPKRTVLLAVTPDQFTLHALPLGRVALTEQLTAVRAGLQLDAQGGISTLSQLDPAALHQLYQTLIAPIEPALKDAKRLLVVADGPLYSLPLELLLTAYDDTQKARFEQAKRQADGSSPDHALLGQYRSLPYLSERYTFRYLPSLAALAAQRRYPKPPVPTTQSIVAFADPVFNPDEPDKTTAAPLTADTQHTLALLNRSGALNGTLPRLPQTADEARALQAALPDAPPPYLRQAAQEATLKQLAHDGKLRGLRYLLLATHGLLGGEFLPPAPPVDSKATLSDLNGLSRGAAPPDPLGQPSLALTLVNPLAGQDGFLTLKEVIEDLNLNTDLAILSACNTAGDSKKSATGEGFAGMTRAFLFAGARHLWVSHWAVESEATRDLVTTAVQTREGGISDPAAALAQAQKTLRASVVTAGQDLQGQPLHLARAHPYFWAPFVTVGD